MASSSSYLLPMRRECYSDLLGRSLVPPEKVTHLNLNHTEVADRDAGIVADLLSNMSTYPNLTSLDLVNTSLSTKGCTSISKALEINSRLKVLRVGQVLRATPSAGLSAIINSFLKNRSVTSLTIQHSCLTMKNLEQLCKVLSTNSSLTTLSLNNFFSESFGKYLERILKAPYLRSLDLSHTALGGVYVTPDSFAKGLSSTTSLQSLILNRCGISDRFADGLATGLRNNTSVTELSLNATSITPDGAGALVQAIMHTTTVTHLNLEYQESRSMFIHGYYVENLWDSTSNGHPQVSWDHFTDLFASHSTLQRINLSNSSDRGPLISLNPSFKINSRYLTHLDLSNVHFAESAIEILFNTLPQNLESLDLKGCFFDLDPDCRAPFLLMRRIVSLIETSPALTELSFGGVGLKERHLWEQGSTREDQAFMPLAEALKTNTLLTSLSISDIDLELPETEELCKAFAENSGLRKIGYTHRYRRDVQFLIQISKLFERHLPNNHTLVELHGVSDSIRYSIIGPVLERNRYRAEKLGSLLHKLLNLPQLENWLQTDESEQESSEPTSKRQRAS